MELRQFVSETLGQIVGGIKDAQENTDNEGALIVPAREGGSYHAQEELDHDGFIHSIQAIDFDVAITTTEATGTKGGIGLFVGAVGLGTQGASDTSNQSVSRIKFTIPIALPSKRVRT